MVLLVIKLIVEFFDRIIINKKVIMTLDMIIMLLVILIAIYTGCVHISLIRFKTATLEMLNEMQELENKAFEHQLQLIKSFAYKDENNKKED